jgi:hypothetical protein
MVRAFIWASTKKGLKGGKERGDKGRLERKMKKRPLPPTFGVFQGHQEPENRVKQSLPSDRGHRGNPVGRDGAGRRSDTEGWEGIEKYGKAKEAWLKKFLSLKRGIPKHDVIYRRVFTQFKTEAIEQCFMAWARPIKQDTDREIIAIDGKTAQGSFNTARLST